MKNSMLGPEYVTITNLKFVDYLLAIRFYVSWWLIKLNVTLKKGSHSCQKEKQELLDNKSMVAIA